MHSPFRSRSLFMDFSRGILAFLVVLTHIRSMVFANAGDVGDLNIFSQLFYFISGLGHEAVMLFFVLSGYLVGGSVIKLVRANTFSFSDYFIARFSRLYAVLLFALMITLGCDLLGAHLDTHGIYTQHYDFSTLKFSVPDRITVNHFLSSLFMLQNFYVPTFGSNVPLWSLNYEFWYYMLFPPLCIGCVYIFRKTFNRTLIFCLLVFLFLIFRLPTFIVMQFSIWLLGLIPVYLSFKQPFYKWIFLAALLAILVLGKVYEPARTNALAYDFVFALMFALALSSIDDDRIKAPGRSLSKFFASFSYTLYLIHFPIIILLLTLCKRFLNTGIWMQKQGRLFLCKVRVQLF